MELIGLAELLGVTSARVRQVLKELVAVGAIKVRTSATGTTITLLEWGRRDLHVIVIISRKK